MEHVDVLIVGAGLSGIGAAYYLQRDCPDRSYLILEARDATGGTWDLHRYPGIRSDSDLHTYGYEFKPWIDQQAIATGDKILAYLRETAAENGIDARIRCRHRVLSADWCSERARWTVDVERTDTGELVQISADWLFCAGGYYRYDAGYTPDFAGRERFTGPVVHPQSWPEDLDYTGKRVVIIGSGATAVTLLPALAERAGHVTMLQRSPTYLVSVPGKDLFANAALRLLGARRGYALARRKNIFRQRSVYQLCRRYPGLMRFVLRRLNVWHLPAGYPVDEHFNPSYNPWDQRLCTVPDADLFRAIGNGSASVVTDHIETFTETGIRLASGRELAADIIVTATGFNLQAFGGMVLTVDGAPVELADTVGYKGMMLSGLPNFAFAIGYTNSSWTLKIDLVCQQLCRLLNHMRAYGYTAVVPELPDLGMPTRPLLDFGAGYVQRAVAALPRQGVYDPWQTSLAYRTDVRLMRELPLADSCLQFSRPMPGPAPAHPQPVPAGSAGA